MSQDLHAELAKAIRGYDKPVNHSRPPAPFTFNPDATPMEQENQILDYFHENWVDNPKKLIKMVRRIYDQVPRFIQKSLLDTVLHGHVNPVVHFIACFREKTNWVLIIKQMLDEGNHGILFFDDQVYGINLKTNKNWLRAKDRWTMEDEMDIMEEAFETWAEENGVTHFLGKVMLFPECGFSGMAYKFDRALKTKG